jgi:cold shock CspA family protein
VPVTGTLRTWHEDRGFGFIAPTHGGPEIFVHISEFPRDGSRPTAGESLVYELGRGKDGKPQAVRVYRQALGKPAEYPRSRNTNRTRQRRSMVLPVIGFALLVAAGSYGYSRYRPHAPWTQPPLPAQDGAVRALPKPAQSQFRCDGRTHCSQMTSCSEATFFLKNCPGSKMDGNGDGVPCEQQWCTGFFAK